MNKSITMKTALAALACTACVSASAQKQYPEQEKMKPGMSEYWTPQPKVVTPGDIKTNSAPSDAIVLFDGKDLSAWQNAKGGPAEWIVKDGVFTVDKKKGDILTKQKFENFQLHIEWCVPENITGTSQGRGNSGIFLQDMYEIQVLDCYNNETYVNGQTGSVYKQTPPLANAMRKPGEWNIEALVPTAKAFLDVEMNMGQMVEDVRLAVAGRVPVEFFGRTGGVIPTPDEVLAAIVALNEKVGE